jgi:group I intron endonuclease
MASGIYQIVNTVDGKRYIGSAVDLHEREVRHFRELRRGMHHSQKLQRAFIKYGEIAFAFEPIITCAKSMRNWYEQQFIDQLTPEYNICKIAGTPAGSPMSKEIRVQIALKQSKSLTHNGETHTYQEWDKILGLASGGIKRRVCMFGTDSEKLFVPPAELWESQKSKMGGPVWQGKTMPGWVKTKMRSSQKERRDKEAETYTHNGETHTHREWSKILGLHPEGFGQRLRLGKKENLFKTTQRQNIPSRSGVSDFTTSEPIIINTVINDNGNEKQSQKRS